MSYRITFLPTADHDIDDIEEYLFQFDADTVLNFFLKLEKQVATLGDMPYLCPVYEADSYFRRMVVNDYRLFYSVDEKQQLVIIHRVFHVSRDIRQDILRQ